MNNKLMFVFGFTAALIVALAFSSVSAKWFGKSGVQFAPNETNANDCSADEKCVMKNAVVSGSVSTSTLGLNSYLSFNLPSGAPGPGFVLAPKFFRELQNYTLALSRDDQRGIPPIFVLEGGSVMSNRMVTERLRVEAIDLQSPAPQATPLGRISYDPFSGIIIDPMASPAQVAIEGDFLTTDKNTFMHLAGNGNAYACLTSEGVLYRSLTPCR